jgi:hypothetical protein
MSCANNQCAAYGLTNNSRCTNLVTPGSSHCETHRPKAASLCNKYKKLSNQANNIDLDRKFDNIQDRITYIMECYVLLDKVFKARTKHRKYAFVPECYDSGHDFQFKLLSDLMKKCESILQKLYILEDSGSENDAQSESSEEELPKPKINEKIKERAKQLRKFRLERDKEVNEFVDEYIKQNEKILKRRKFLNRQIMECVFLLFEEAREDNNICLIVRIVSAFHLVKWLIRYSYFEETFEPDYCKDCKCFTTYAGGIGCHCVYINDTCDKYLNLSTEETLKQFYGALLLQKTKLLPLIGDIILFHDFYGDDAIFTKVHFKWNDNNKRLKLYEGQNPDENCYPKVSKFMAFQRKKDKYKY